MTYPTLKEIRDDIIVESGLVSGSAVQTYTEPQADQAINRMFGFLWNKQRWDHLWDWQIGTLDGVTGKFTTALTGVRQYEDIASVRIGDGRGTGIPRSYNNAHLYATGSYPMNWTVLPWDDADGDTKFIKFWPITATGTVEMLCGHRPDRFEDDADIVPFDRDLITLGSLWYLVGSDGLNPAGADKAQGVFDTYFQDYQARYGAREIGHGVGYRDDSTFRLS